jgi:hypothetical protein
LGQSPDFDVRMTACIFDKGVCLFYFIFFVEENLTARDLAGCHARQKETALAFSVERGKGCIVRWKDSRRSGVFVGEKGTAKRCRYRCDA